MRGCRRKRVQAGEIWVSFREQDQGVARSKKCVQGKSEGLYEGRSQCMTCVFVSH
eukprot:m.1673502 g.1673502  ORF g.1673502 m.1673502 type:complete len:55 (+) comp177188_c0_seq1:14-178(+)